jgi:cytochrome c-type biogenesis protein CcmH/NrfG
LAWQARRYPEQRVFLRNFCRVTLVAAVAYGAYGVWQEVRVASKRARARGRCAFRSTNCALITVHR